MADEVDLIIPLDDMKEHLKIETDTEDTLVTTYIQAATSYCEKYTGLAFGLVDWEYTCHRFERVIRLPSPPLQSVTSVQYYDTDGNLQTLSTDFYGVDCSSVFGSIYLKQQPPRTDHHNPNPVIIEYTSGYGVDDTPQVAKQAIRLLATDYYYNRGDSKSQTLDIVHALLDQIRVVMI